MNEYHKIQTVWLRDPATNHKTLLEGHWALPEFAYLADCQWNFTEKIDGTNIRIIWDGAAVTFKGKTEAAQLPAKLVKRLNERFRPEPFIGDGPLCLYAEGYGAGIQSGGIYRQDQDVILFDVKVGDWWLKREDVVAVAQKHELPVVPSIGIGTLHDMIEMVSRGGFQSAAGTGKAEGIVARPMVELFARNGDRIITKLKAKDFK